MMLGADRAPTEHKHMPEPDRRIEVFTGASRRRSWSRDEKAAIIPESYGAGERSVPWRAGIVSVE
jgi:hypothetical protein